MEHEELLQHGAFLRGLAAHLVAGEAAADDLVQETWLTALERPPRAMRSPRGWLGTVARNVARMGRREGVRRRRREEQVAAAETTVPDGDELIRRELLRDVVDAVLALPEPYQTTLLDRYWRGLGPAEIARRDGVPAETVRARLKRGLDRLRDRLDRKSGGDRAVWTVSLAAMAGLRIGGAAGAGAGEAGTAAGAAAAGVLVMTLSTKITVAAVSGLIVALAVWFGTRTGADEPGGGTRTLIAEDGAPARPVPGGGEAPAAAINAERFQEPRSETAGGARSGTAARLEITADDGTVLGGARVVVLSGAKIVAETAADASGVAVLVAMEEEPEILVLAAGFAPHRRKMRLDPGLQPVVIPVGAEIAGQVTVDGRVPETPVPIWVSERTGWPEFRRLPLEAVDRLLGEGPAGTFDSPCVTTGDGGRFRFRGVAADWSGSLDFDGYAIGSGTAGGRLGETTLFLEAPGARLDIDLHRLPRLRVRILAADGRTPVAGARLEWLMRGTSDWSIGATTDAEGRATRVVNWQPDAVDLRAWSPDGLLSAAHSMPGPFEADRDFGDLVLSLPGGRTVSVVVVDPEGVPVAGALAGTEPKSAGRTDAAGRAEFVLPVGTGSFRVAACGFRVATAVAPEEPAEPVRVVLQPSNGIEVDVVDPQGRGMAGAHVRFSAPRRFLQDLHQEFLDPLLDAAGPCRQTQSRGGDDGCYSELMAGSSGRVALWGIEPGVEITVALMDPWAGVIREERVSVAPLERRRMEIRLAQGPRDFRGTIIGPDGRPASGASVRIHHYAGSSATTPTDREGAFCFEGMLAAEVHLDVEHPAAARFCDRRFRVPPEGEAARIDLSPGNTVTLLVVDPAGGPVPARSAWLSDDGHRDDHVSEVRAGVFRFDRLDRGRVEFFALVGSKQHAVVHDTGTAEARLVVPMHGSVTVSWDPALTSEDRAFRLHVVRADDQKPDETEYGLGEADVRAGASRIPALLPGTWTLTLESLHPDDSASLWHPLTAPVSVEILPGRETSIRCQARN